MRPAQPFRGSRPHDRPSPEEAAPGNGYCGAWQLCCQPGSQLGKDKRKCYTKLMRRWEDFMNKYFLVAASSLIILAGCQSSSPRPSTEKTFYIGKHRITHRYGGTIAVYMENATGTFLDIPRGSGKTFFIIDTDYRNTWQNGGGGDPARGSLYADFYDQAGRLIRNSSIEYSYKAMLDRCTNGRWKKWSGRLVRVDRTLPGTVSRVRLRSTGIEGRLGRC